MGLITEFAFRPLVFCALATVALVMIPPFDAGRLVPGLLPETTSFRDSAALPVGFDPVVAVPVSVGFFCGVVFWARDGLFSDASAVNRRNARVRRLEELLWVEPDDDCELVTCEAGPLPLVTPEIIDFVSIISTGGPSRLITSPARPIRSVATCNL